MKEARTRPNLWASARPRKPCATSVVALLHQKRSLRARLLTEHGHDGVLSVGADALVDHHGAPPGISGQYRAVSNNGATDVRRHIIRRREFLSGRHTKQEVYYIR